MANHEKKALSKFAIFNLPLTGDRVIEIYFVKYEKKLEIGFSIQILPKAFYLLGI